jgi:hypothetical protein
MPVKPIKTFDRATCRTLSDAALAALQEVAERHGLQVEAGRGSFAPSDFTVKFTFKVVGEGGISPADRRDCQHLGLPETCLGQTIQGRLGSYQITGFKPRSPKYQVIVKYVSGAHEGRSYKMPAVQVSADLARAA